METPKPASNTKPPHKDVVKLHTSSGSTAVDAADGGDASETGDRGGTGIGDTEGTGKPGGPRGTQDIGKEGGTRGSDRTCFPPTSDSLIHDQMRLRQRKKMLMRFLLALQEKLLSQEVSLDTINKAAKVLRPDDYDMVVEERVHERMCGFPTCCNPLPEPKRSRYRIDRRARKVFDTRSSPLRNFCSEQCYLSSQRYKLSLSDDPIEMRRGLPFESLSKLSGGVLEHNLDRKAPQTEVEAEAEAEKRPSEPSTSTSTDAFEDHLHCIATREMAKLRLSESSGADSAAASPPAGASEASDNGADLAAAFEFDVDALHEAPAQLRSALTPFSRLLLLLSQWTGASSGTPSFLQRLRQGHLDDPLTDQLYDADMEPRKEVVARFLITNCSAGLEALQPSSEQVKPFIRRTLPRLVQTFSIQSAAPALQTQEWRFLSLCCVAVLVRCAADNDANRCDFAKFIEQISSSSSSSSLHDLLARLDFEFEHFEIAVDAVISF